MRRAFLLLGTVQATLIFTITSAWTSTAVSRYAREELEEHGRMAAVTWGRAVITVPLSVLAATVVPVLMLNGTVKAAQADQFQRKGPLGFSF